LPRLAFPAAPTYPGGHQRLYLVRAKKLRQSPVQSRLDKPSLGLRRSILAQEILEKARIEASFRAEVVFAHPDAEGAPDIGEVYARLWCAIGRKLLLFQKGDKMRDIPGIGSHVCSEELRMA